MSHAICTKCGQKESWSAQRGVRLADFRSRCCGAPLKGLTTGRKGKPGVRVGFNHCDYCGRKARLDKMLRVPVAVVDIHGRHLAGGGLLCDRMCSFSLKPEGSPDRWPYQDLPESREYVKDTDQVIDADKWDAADDLKKHWEAFLHGQGPMPAEVRPYVTLQEPSTKECAPGEGSRRTPGGGEESRASPSAELPREG